MEDGLIFYLGPSPDTVVAGGVKDFAALEIRNGSLRFYLNFGDKTRIEGEENDNIITIDDDNINTTIFYTDHQYEVWVDPYAEKEDEMEQWVHVSVEWNTNTTNINVQGFGESFATSAVKGHQYLNTNGLLQVRW